MNPDVAVNESDYFALICPNCRTTMEVRRLVFDTSKTGVMVVEFWVQCPKCNTPGHRKIYTKFSGEQLKWPAMTNIQKAKVEFNKKMASVQNVEDVEDKGAEDVK